LLAKRNIAGRQKQILTILQPAQLDIGLLSFWREIPELRFVRGEYPVPLFVRVDITSLPDEFRYPRFVVLQDIISNDAIQSGRELPDNSPAPNRPNGKNTHPVDGAAFNFYRDRHHNSRRSRFRLLMQPQQC